MLYIEGIGLKYQRYHYQTNDIHVLSDYVNVLSYFNIFSLVVCGNLDYFLNWNGRILSGIPLILPGSVVTLCQGMREELNVAEVNLRHSSENMCIGVYFGL